MAIIASADDCEDTFIQVDTEALRELIIENTHMHGFFT